VGGIDLDVTLQLNDLHRVISKGAGSHEGVYANAVGAGQPMSVSLMGC